VRRAVALAALGVLAGCDGAHEPAAFEHYPAVERAIARLEAEVAAQAAPAPAPAVRELDPERVPGLVRMLAHSRGRARELPLEEVRGLGDAATPTLAALAAGAETAPEERAAACELLGDSAISGYYPAPAIYPPNAGPDQCEPITVAKSMPLTSARSSRSPAGCIAAGITAV